MADNKKAYPPVPQTREEWEKANHDELMANPEYRAMISKTLKGAASRKTRNKS